ncbi:MAG: hypothetical protein ACOH2V_00010 [Candidatus Saccharimonadaceae bacterium]
MGGIGLANALTKKKITGSDTQLAKSIDTGYTASATLGNKEFGGVSNKLSKIFGGGDRAKQYQQSVNKVNSENLLKKNAIYSSAQNQLSAQNTDIFSKTDRQLQGGYNTNMLSSKKGGKISPQYLSKIKNKALKNVKKHQAGGQLNVIPEGALHARKNNYSEELASKVTNKGIPVITYDEGGDITQHAEIEHSEIIFNLETSKKLENLFKEHKDAKDDSRKKELEIECGKFLSQEILVNTEDNVGLLEQK